MRKHLFATLVFLTIAGLSPHTASALLPGDLPRIPRLGKPTPEPAPAESAQPATTASETPPATQLRQSTPGQDQPTIRYDSLQITAWTNNSYKGNFDVWSWVPQMEFRVNGPVPSGSQLYVEFQQPGGTAPWLSFDCGTAETQKGYSFSTGCGGRQVEDKSITAVGPVNFAIKLRNELAGGHTTIFSGRMKVAKTLSSEQGPKAANKFVHYVDHDWNLPIGYVWYAPHDVFGWDYPDFNIAFWVRGHAVSFDPHLFYKGQEIGRMFMDGMQVGRASCEARVQHNTTRDVNNGMPQKAQWARVDCNFPMVKQWDKTNDGRGQSNTNDMFKMASNPGEYEFKVLWNNKLARSIKFTVGPDGKLDNGIAAANRLGSGLVIVPVQIVGDQDGAWDRTAWKTDAFYGHPLTGFTWLPQ